MKVDKKTTRAGPLAFHFDPSLQEFERQPGEPEKAFEAFEIYRDLGRERSLRKASEIFRARVGPERHADAVERIVEGYSASYQWRRRLEALGRERDRLRREKQVEEIQEMNERHVKLALQLQEIASIEVTKLNRLAKASAEKQEFILAYENVLKTIDQGIKLERTGRGEPESIVEERKKTSASEEREALRALLQDPESLDAMERITDRINASNDLSGRPREK